MSWKTTLILSGSTGGSVTQFPSFFGLSTIGGFTPTDILMVKTGAFLIRGAMPSSSYNRATGTEEVTGFSGLGTAFSTNDAGTAVYTQPLAFYMTGNFSRCRTSGTKTFTVGVAAHAGTNTPFLKFQDFTEASGFPIDGQHSNLATEAVEYYQESGSATAPDGGSDGQGFITYNSDSYESAVTTGATYRLMQQFENIGGYQLRRIYVEKINSGGSTVWRGSFTWEGSYPELIECSDGSIVLNGKEETIKIGSTGTSVWKNLANDTKNNSKKLHFNPARTLGAWAYNNKVYIWNFTNGDIWYFSADAAMPATGTAGGGQATAQNITYYANGALGFDADGYLWVGGYLKSCISRVTIDATNRTATGTKHYGLGFFDNFGITGGNVHDGKVFAVGKRGTDSTTNHLGCSVICLNTDFTDTLTQTSSQSDPMHIRPNVVPNNSYQDSSYSLDAPWMTTVTTSHAVTGTLKQAGTADTGLVTAFTGTYNYNATADSIISKVTNSYGNNTIII